MKENLFYFFILNNQDMIQLEKYISGHFEKGPGGYSYFVPEEINHQWNCQNII
jgi:hypothetical protein